MDGPLLKLGTCIVWLVVIIVQLYPAVHGSEELPSSRTSSGIPTVGDTASGVLLLPSSGVTGMTKTVRLSTNGVHSHGHTSSQTSQLSDRMFRQSSSTEPLIHSSLTPVSLTSERSTMSLTTVPGISSTVTHIQSSLSIPVVASTATLNIDETVRAESRSSVLGDLYKSQSDPSNMTEITDPVTQSGKGRSITSLHTTSLNIRSSSTVSAVQGLYLTSAITVSISSIHSAFSVGILPSSVSLSVRPTATTIQSESVSASLNTAPSLYADTTSLSPSATSQVIQRQSSLPSTSVVREHSATVYSALSTSISASSTIQMPVTQPTSKRSSSAELFSPDITSVTFLSESVDRLVSITISDIVPSSPGLGTSALSNRIAYTTSHISSSTQMSVTNTLLVTDVTTDSTLTTSINLSEEHQSTPKTDNIQTVTHLVPDSHNDTANVTVNRKTIRLTVQFSGDCGKIDGQGMLEAEFWLAFMDVLLQSTNITVHRNQILLERFLYKPLRVVIVLEHLVKADLFVIEINETIHDAKFQVPILFGNRVLTYTAESLFVSDAEDDTDDSITETRHSLDPVDITIIVLAAVLFAIFICIGIIVLCRECYMRKRAASFNLVDKDKPIINFKMSDFELMKIPRPKMIYHDNRGASGSPSPAANGRPKPKQPKRRAPYPEVDRVRVTSDNFHVRMSDHRDGLIVGVTCMVVDGDSPSDCDTFSSVGKDVSKVNLLKGDNSCGSSNGLTNPSYTSTDGSVRGSQVVIEDDEHEQLL